MSGTITHYWSGTTLVVTSDSGTSACNLQGPQGDIGIRGPQGIPGIGTAGASPTITISDISGGHRVTITDATGSKSFDVMDGGYVDIDLSEYYTKNETEAAINNAVNNLEIPDSTPIATRYVAGKVKPDNATVFVSADGTLSATIEAAEIREVYVGSSAPTDPNVLLWVNPNEGSAAVAATADYVDDTVGDISTALDILNGEEI